VLTAFVHILQHVLKHGPAITLGMIVIVGLVVREFLGHIQNVQVPSMFSWNRQESLKLPATGKITVNV
jgi:hypothetical protein